MTPNEKLQRAMQGARGVAIGDAVWYLAMAGTLWLLFYVLFRRGMQSRKISGKWPGRRQISREIWQSLRSLAIYGLVALPIVYAAWSGWTRMYPRVSDYGWPWFVVSVMLAIVLHDAYFYWTHRLMHLPQFYRLRRGPPIRLAV
jgi:Delta7-sterol 5-desaturase